MGGYAVVDVETTGLFPGGHDRVVEIAVVQVAPDGGVEESWSTLVNPGRDLGPQEIHGIRAADVRHAPTFADVAGHVAGLLRGRAFVAHNAQFDRRFMWHEFARAGMDVPLIEPTSLCTMRTGALLSPDAPRSLAGSCGHHGIELATAHEAMSDAAAAAGLLRVFLDRGARTTVDGWDDVVELAETTAWPEIPARTVTAVARGVSTARDTHFLARLATARNRPITTWVKEEYLELVDRALLDRHLSAREHDQLAAYCAEAELGRSEVDELHREYLTALTSEAWADGVLTAEETNDFLAVAQMLQVPDAEARQILTAGQESAASTSDDGAVGRRSHFAPGDLVVFTGSMREPRDVWERRARAAGLVPHPSVTKKVRLVVAADPDSMSGKARKAETYGIAVVGEAGFGRMIGVP